jgi:hypothetical protein
MALEVQGAPVDLAVVAVVEAATVDGCGLLYELPYGYTQFL